MTTIFTKRIFYFTLSVVFLGAFYHASALTLSPSRIEIRGDAGTTVTQKIALFNDSKVSAQTYYVSYANFQSQGEIGSPLFTEAKDDLGTWMHTDDKITIPAGGSKEVLLSIAIPKDAVPGGHFAAVFFGTTPENTNGKQVAVSAKTGTLILLSVNGDIVQKGGLSSFSAKGKFFHESLPVPFEYRFTNDGTDRIKPIGQITIRNGLYIPTIRIDANPVSGNVLPKSTRLFSVDWEGKSSNSNTKKSFFEHIVFQWKNFAFGPYIATLDLTYGPGMETSKKVFLFVLPWQLITCLIVVLWVVVFIGEKLLRRYNARIIKKARVYKHTDHA